MIALSPGWVQPRCSPPSNASIWPVIAGAARIKRNAAAISSGPVPRRSGILRQRSRNCSGLCRSLGKVGPGPIPFTRIRGASARAIVRVSVHKADLLTVYLLPIGNEKVSPMLEKQLKKGARIVAHDFEFSAWKPEKIEDIDDDGEGRSHRLYLYRR